MWSSSPPQFHYVSVFTRAWFSNICQFRQTCEGWLKNARTILLMKGFNGLDAYEYIMWNVEIINEYCIIAIN